jgi:hypothetical protein
VVERFSGWVDGVVRDPPFDKLRVGMMAKTIAREMRVDWERFRSREADFSTTLLTMRL